MESKKNLKHLLDISPLSRIRRNHGLEHATLHLLSQRYPHTSLAGHSDLGGFWIMGDVDTQAVRSAVDEALRRMRSGEASLAVHPFCGTNLVTSGTLAGLGAAATLFGVRRRHEWFERLPLAVLTATLLLVVAQPLGMHLQAQITTSGQPGSLQVLEIQARPRRGIKAHRILTRD